MTQQMLNRRFSSNVISAWDSLVGSCRNVVSTYAKQFLVLFLLFSCITAPLFLADVLYIDDLARHVSGGAGWDMSSRYLSDILAPYIHGNKFLADVSPLPSIIAIVVLSLSGMIILQRTTNSTKWTLWQYISVLPMGISPYFLQCLSYQYDAPYMAASILFSTLPLLFIYTRPIIQVVAAFVCTVCMCCTYQAASGILPMLIFFVAYSSWLTKGRLGIKGKDGRTAWKVIAYAAIGYIVGMLCYEVFLVKDVVEYASASTPPLASLGGTVVSNMTEYFRTIRADLRFSWKLAIVVVACGFVFAAVLQYRNSGRRHWMLALVSSIAMLVVLLILSYGAYLVLEKPFLAPRGMYGFGVYIALICLFISTTRNTFIFRIAILVLVWFFVTFAFLYPNALKQQQEWTDFRTEEVITELSSLGLLDDDPSKQVMIEGNIGRAPTIDEYCKEYRLIERLVPSTFYGPGWTGYQQLILDYGFKFDIVTATEQGEWDDLPLVKATSYYAIRTNGSDIKITLYERPEDIASTESRDDASRWF